MDKALQSLAEFFNDVIGAVIPGVVLGVGLLVIHSPMWMRKSSILPSNLPDGLTVSVIVALAFATGHGLIAAYSHLFRFVFQKWPAVKGRSEIIKKVVDTQDSYTLFRALVAERIKTHARAVEAATDFKWDFHDLRSVALSISTEAAALARRFMFLSLLCTGVGTALTILALELLICIVWFPSTVVTHSWKIDWIAPSLLLASAVLFILRADEFYKRALSAPFAVAIAEVLFPKLDDADKK